MFNFQYLIKVKNTNNAPPCTNFLLARKAFSLIEVLIAMSVLTVLGYFMADMIVGQQQAITGSESRMENIELFRQVQTLLSDKASCEKTLTGDSTASPAIPAVKLDLTKDSNGKYSKIAIADANQAIRDGVENIVFKKGNTYGNGSVKVTGIAVKNESLEIKSGETKGSGTAILLFSTERLKGSLKGKTITRNFLLRVVADSSGNITECFADIDAITSTAALEATKQVLKMNKCDYDADAETVSCAGNASMDCQIEASCTKGTSISNTRSGKNVCCESIALSAKETCERMGGTYQPSTCKAGNYQVIANADVYSISGKNRLYNLPFCDGTARRNYTTKLCKLGYTATNIIWKLSATFSTTLHKQDQAITKNANGYQIKLCLTGKKSTHWATISYTMTCKESSCTERCEFGTNTALMKNSKSATCNVLGGRYNPTTNQCEKTGAQDLSTLTCRNSSKKCESHELQVKRYNIWRACFISNFYHGANSKQECEKLLSNPQAGLKMPLFAIWECPGTNPNDCNDPRIIPGLTTQKLSCPQPRGHETSLSTIFNSKDKNKLQILKDECKTKTAGGTSHSFIPCSSSSYADFDSKTGISPTTGRRYYCSTVSSSYARGHLIHDFFIPAADKPYRCCK